MLNHRIGVVIPTYGAHDYARAALESFFATTPLSWGSAVIVVDDASPNYEVEHGLAFGDIEQRPWRQNAHFIRFDKNGGLTRSWNAGLKTFIDSGNFSHLVVTNSDVLFTPYWYEDLIHATDVKNFALVGPVTNAPGTEQHQCVTNFAPTFELTDDKEKLGEISALCRNEYHHEVREAPLNGFFLFARARMWDAGRYDYEHVFNPRNDFDSKGRPNPTPLMTLNEYELQRRWRAKDWQIGFCPGSFIFHYRAVSRGDKYKRGLWHRKQA